MPLKPTYTFLTLVSPLVLVNPFQIVPNLIFLTIAKKCLTEVLPENFTVEDTHISKNGLNILESLHQKVKKPTVGIQQQSTPLMGFY